MRHAIAILMGGAACFAAWGATPETGAARAAVAPRSSLISSTGRFRAIGPSAAANQQLLLAAEDLADRLARVLEQPLPASRLLPFRFAITDGDTAGPAALHPRQVVSPEGVGQELTIVQPDQVDSLAASQAVVALLTSRYLHPLQTVDERQRRPAAPPVWFAAGLSRHLYPEARRADLRVCRAAAGSPDLETMLAITDTVSDAQRPDCTALVSWLFAQAKPAEIRARCFPIWARGDALNLGDLLALIHAADRREAQIRWDVWIVAQRGIWAYDAFARQDLLLRVDTLLDTPSGLIPVELPPDAPDRVTPATLIARRGESWTAAAAADRLARLRALPAGAAPEEAELIEAYAAVLEPIAHPSFARRLTGPSRNTLTRRLAQADALRADWRRRLDEPPTEPPPPAPGESPD